MTHASREPKDRRTKVNPEKINANRRRDPRSRLLALLIGPWYLLMVSSIIHQATEAPAGIVLGLVLLGAAVIIAVLLVFGVKAYEQKGPVRQFRLSSLMLLILPFAIYLAAIRCVTDKISAIQLNLLYRLVIGIVCIGFMSLSTAILLWLADALMWLALGAVRAIRFLRAPVETDRSDSGSTN